MIIMLMNTRAPCCQVVTFHDSRVVFSPVYALPSAGPRLRRRGAWILQNHALHRFEVIQLHCLRSVHTGRSVCNLEAAAEARRVDVHGDPCVSRYYVTLSSLLHQFKQATAAGILRPAVCAIVCTQYLRNLYQTQIY